jgi:hypothetical protein
MIFRRVGETVGEKVVERFKGKYASVEEFCNLIISNVIGPVIGMDQVHCNHEDNKLVFVLDTCPYKKAGFPIKDMSFFCDYTEGLLDTAVSMAFPGKTFEMVPKDLISGDCASCTFEINIS